MKVGVRKPSIKKSVRARTTGQIKRSAKSAVNPFYGKKGVGLAKDPERSVKNAVYKKTTVGVSDVLHDINDPNRKSSRSSGASNIILMVLLIALACMCLLLTIVYPIAIAGTIISVFLVIHLTRKNRSDT